MALVNHDSRAPTSGVRAVTAPAMRSWWPERNLVPESYEMSHPRSSGRWR